MLIPGELWDRIAVGEVTVAFRRWKRPTVKSGGNLRSGAGYLAIDDVRPVSEDELTDADARSAGYDGVETLLATLRPPEPGRRLHRIEFHVAGADPRDELRESTDLGDAELREIGERLDRLDRNAPPRWTRATLAAIDAHPEVVSTDLAEYLGRERFELKRDIAKLKRLGLTISHRRGYRLSPRGEVVLRWLSDQPD